MQIVAIDTSLNSTACVIFDKNSNYHFFSWRKNLDPNNIWNRSMSWCNMYNVTYQTGANFTTNEVLKLEDYFKISSEIVTTIDQIIDKNLPVKVLIEGYSQKSKAGSDHDLVAYGTLVRLKLYSKYNSLNVIPPKSLKKFTAQLTYPVTPVIEYAKNGKPKKPKPIVYRNNNGIPGGSFDKFQMFEAIVDYKSNDTLSKWCDINWSDIKDRAAIPKPADDLIDAFWLCEVGRNNLI